jgi:hypothetical protein
MVHLWNVPSDEELVEGAHGLGGELVAIGERLNDLAHYQEATRFRGSEDTLWRRSERRRGEQGVL